MIITDNPERDKNVLPTRFLEKEGKLFIWKDLDHEFDSDIMDILIKYDKIDSVANMGKFEDVIDDAKKGMHYYFCKEDFSRFKSVKTNIALGYYEPPKLKCQ